MTIPFRIFSRSILEIFSPIRLPSAWIDFKVYLTWKILCTLYWVRPGQSKEIRYDEGIKHAKILKEDQNMFKMMEFGLLPMRWSIIPLFVLLRHFLRISWKVKINLTRTTWTSQRHTACRRSCLSVSWSLPHIWHRF